MLVRKTTRYGFVPTRLDIGPVMSNAMFHSALFAKSLGDSDLAVCVFQGSPGTLGRELAHNPVVFHPANFAVGFDTRCFFLVGWRARRDSNPRPFAGNYFTVSNSCRRLERMPGLGGCRSVQTELRAQRSPAHAHVFYSLTLTGSAVLQR